MIPRLQKALDDAGVHYDTIPHQEAFTAQEIAANVHVSGRQLAKAVILKSERGRFVMAVIPASSRLDMDELERVTGEPRLSLAAESDLATLFPDCEVGAMPPFGRLYDIDVFADRSFSTIPDIVFEAGNHHEAVRVKYDDFERLARPELGTFSYAWIAAPHPELEEL